MVARTHHHAVVPGLALCALATSSLLALAQEPGKSTHPEDSPGPPGQATSNGPPSVTRYGRFLVGDSAPDVILQDQASVRYQLGTARREKPQMLVFARTPNDVRTVDEVARELEALGIGVVAIAPFRRDRVVPANKKMNVRLLTDGASITARNYGVWDAVTSNPRPAVFLIDRAGKILMMMAGGFPSDGELVRLTRESLERAGDLVAQPPPVIE
jgi:peroxiredoxin